MVNEKVLIRDKWAGIRKIIFILFIVFIVLLILAVVFFFGAFMSGEKTEIIIENPIKNIIFAHTDNTTGTVDKEAVVEQAVIEFNADYINYILVGLGVGNLHKSKVGYGNPIIEFVLDDEYWNSELDSGILNTGRGEIENEDLLVTMTREEAVLAIMSSDIEQFMKDSVNNGNTKIEMIAGKIELGTKGYLAMYKDITGEDLEVEE